MKTTEGTNYRFYALRNEESRADSAVLEQQLTLISREGKQDEVSAFLEFAKARGAEPITLDAIVQMQNQQNFKFHSTNPAEDADLSLSFRDFQASREAIAQDLANFLAFKRF